MSFFNPTKLYCGAPNYQEILGGAYRHALLVTDPYMVDSGTVRYVTEPLEAMGLSVVTFSEVIPDPTIDQVTAGVHVLLKEEPDVLVALGGGSAIDTAKAILYFARKAGCEHDIFFLAIPTTSGTGSEMTSFSIITDPKTKQKHELIDDSLLPQASILDPYLTMTVPPQTTGETGIDVLTHAVEAYVSVAASDFTDACAEKAIQLVVRYLRLVRREPKNLDARLAMHHASSLAGMAFNHAGLGINHSLAHAIGAWAHLPHGRTNGILMPYVIDFNAADGRNDRPAAQRYADIAAIFGCASQRARQSTRNLIRAIFALNHDLNIPKSFQEAGVNESAFLDALPNLVERAMHDRCTPSNPVVPRPADLEQIFLNAYYGRWR